MKPLHSVSPAGRNASFPIPSLAPPQNSGWDEMAGMMKAVRPLFLRQPWRPQREPGFSPAWARLAIQGNLLLFQAKMRDDRPYNSATRRNEETWTTGDVVELFLQEENSDDYYEFHVTPENQRLQLHFPHARAVRSGVPVQKWMVPEDLFESSTRILPGQTGWYAFLRVDLKALFGAVPSRFKFLVGRYDVQPGRPQPVISCLGRLTICDFHHLPEWTRAEMAFPADSPAAGRADVFEGRRV